MRARTMLALIAATTFVLAGCGSSSKPQASPPTSAPTSTSTSLPPTTTTFLPMPYLSIYPFATVEQARAWQRDYRENGHQPWHLDAGITASSFVDWIGGSGQVDNVLGVREDVHGAHVTLGYHNPNGVPVAAGVVHLVRVGSGSDAPWEVVGDEQSSSFTLTSPRYGATASSPLHVGGQITGVDESIHLRVTQLSSSAPIGEHCCVAAGGSASPWSATIAYSHATDPVLVVSATTGGHLQKIERFVFTALNRGVAS